MVKIFYRSSCVSSRQAFSWLKEYNVSSEFLKITGISKEEIIQLLSFSEHGFEELLKRQSSVNKKKISYLHTMNFTEGVDYLLNNIDLLKTPIILSDNKYMIGFNEDNIRQFLPKGYRNRIYY